MDGDPHAPVIIKAETDISTPEAIDFFRWLSICISTWAFVDRRLYQIFHHAMGFDQRQSALVYYGNRQFSGHLRMTDKALKMFLPKEEFEAEWRPLRNEARNLSHTRNILAHHPRKRLGTAKNGMAFDIFSIHIMSAS